MNRKNPLWTAQKKIIIHWYSHKSELYYDMASLHSLSSHTVSPLYILFGLPNGLFDNNSESYCIHVQITVLSILMNLSHRASTFSSYLCPALMLCNNPQILHLKCL